MDKILSLSEKFALPAGEKTAVPFGNGHINNTYLITIDGVKERYILQRINTSRNTCRSGSAQKAAIRTGRRSGWFRP